MSYARFSETSDVYVLATFSGSLQCCGCQISESAGSEHFDSTAKMLEHLREHALGGDRVSDDCLSRLSRDRQNNDDYIAEQAAGLGLSQ